MHPGKLPLLIILLVTVTALVAAVFGRTSTRLTKLSILLMAALSGAVSVISGYFGVLASTRGWISLSKHGGSATVFSASDNPPLFLVAVGGLFLVSFATGYAAVWLARGRHRVGA
ncbi:hypothetical protein [Lysobacter sp. Root494]|uniref:hypothetical protein n=1 Tax=Lysobacter sp. Root494 TaxID=1736549 RepID=UPI0012FA079A|nr:hypothetical protein [Lysobacter sp. Root494]